MTNTTRPAEEDGGNLPPLPAMIPEGTALAHAVREYARQAVHQAQERIASPVLYVSPAQLAEHSDSDCPCQKCGNYLPARKTPKGNFTMPLYAAPGAAAAAPSRDAEDADRWRTMLKGLRSRFPGPGYGKKLRIVDVCPVTGDEKEVDIVQFIDAVRAAQAQGGAA